MALAVSQRSAVANLNRAAYKTAGRVCVPKLPSWRNVAFRNAAAKVEASADGASSVIRNNLVLETFDFVRKQLPKLVGAVALAAVLVCHVPPAQISTSGDNTDGTACCIL